MNAKQLKDSILQYAMQGKIVSQVLNEEPASVLVERISNEKQQLIKEKIIKKVKVNPISVDDILWSVPPTWEWVRAAEVLDVRDGTHDTPQYVQEGIPLVTSKNLKKGEIVFDDIKFISLEDHNEIEKRSKVDTGDILFAMIGTIGNPVLVKKDRDFSVKNVGIFKSYPDNKMNMEYVYYYLLYIESLLKKEASGGVQSFVSLTVLRNLMLPVPPLKEQELIVKKISQLLTKVDLFEHASFTLNNLIEAFPEKLDQSILQYAMQGKLVEQDLKDESVSELIERIKVEKTRLIEQKVIKKEKELPPITEDEIPFEIPDTWKWARLKEVCIINPKNSVDDDLEAGFIPMKLIMDGFNNEHTFEVRKWKDIKKGFTHFQSNDIVIAKITPCFENRKSAIIGELPNNVGAGTTELYVIRSINHMVYNKYLLWLFKTQHFIENGIATYTGTAGQQRVAKRYIENYLVPIPPYNEQLRIVEAIEEAHNKIVKL